MRTTAVFLLLAGGAVATWLLNRPAAPAAVDVAAGEAMPLGYYMRDTVIAGTDDAGRIYYRIFAELVEQASQKADLVLTRVRVEYEESENVHWTVSAARGVAPHGREYLELFDGVRLATSGEAGTEQVVVETPTLRLDSEAYSAATDEPVSIVRGEMSLSATGFSVDLKEDVIELHDNVEAISEP